LEIPSSGLQRIIDQVDVSAEPVRWIGEVTAARSFEIAACKGIAAQDAMTTGKPSIAEIG
jgi:hypothetical protein